VITQEEAERAVHFIAKSAPDYAQAKATRRYLEEFRKSKKALLINETEGTVQERESYAYAHKDYQALLGDLRAAIEEEETLAYQMKAAEIKCELWRSQEASSRGQDRAAR
jgi:hypothetical protein